MRIQSAGRLGNNLFIWAYAFGKSVETGKRVTIFFDRFHSNLGHDELETIELLESDMIHFTRSDYLGMILKFLDWLRKNFNPMYHLATNILCIGTESEGIVRNRFLVRGYFQDAVYPSKNASQIKSVLNGALMEVKCKSELIHQLDSKFDKYQVVHLRLGDYLGSTYGTVNSNAYSNLIEKGLPVIVCTDGNVADVAKYLDFDVDLIITPNESTSWETLAIFSSSSRFIGVNSTLSWWGAFMASQNGAKAFLPESWSTNEKEDPAAKLKIKGVSTYQNDFR